MKKLLLSVLFCNISGMFAMNNPRWVSYAIANTVSAEHQARNIYQTLNAALESQDIEGIKKYIEEHPKLNLNEQDENGNTCLHEIVKKNHPLIAQALIEFGFADPHRVNKKGETPASLACANSCAALFMRWQRH